MHTKKQSGERRGLTRHASLLCTLIFSVLCFCGCSQEEEVFLLAADDSEEEEAEPKEMTDKTDHIQSAQSTEEIAEADETETEELFVYVCGAVAVPGLYSLPPGSRIYDAMEAAGGLTKEACLTYWNQAAYLTDGQMIFVPTQEEANNGTYAASGADGQQALESTQQQALESTQQQTFASDDGRVNINTASAQDLTIVPGIGEARAAAIIAYRQEHGNFSSIEEIKNVSGIGDALFEKMKDYIRVS